MSETARVEPLTSRAAQRQQTRANMLEAALQLIVEQGMRAVRHRAVAQRAGVSLGTTTYHFSSIEELIVSAFEHWRASIPLEENPFFAQLSSLLQPFGPEVVPTHSRPEVAQQLYCLSVNYLCDQLSGKKQDRIIELAFYHESLRSQSLRQLVLQSWQAELDYLEEVHRLVGSPLPSTDARITFSLFRQLEQGAIIADLAEPDSELIKDILRRHMSQCFEVPLERF